jgi:hypothetical protein
MLQVIKYASPSLVDTMQQYSGPKTNHSWRMIRWFRGI